MITTLTDDYGIERDGNFTVMFDNINETLRISNSFAEEIQNTTEGASGFSSTGGDAGIAEVMSQSLKLPFKQVKTIVSMKSILSTKLGIPVWVLNAVISIILIVIAMIFLTVLFKPPGGA